MDYATPSFRKSKGDKKAKGRYAVYKKGGGKKNRSMNVKAKDKECCEDCSSCGCH